MKIALVDNMNNNFFALARYLKDLGVETDLYLIPGRQHLHFDPKEDTWYNLENEFWIKEFPLTYRFTSYIRPVKRIMSRTFQRYDRIIACGSSLGLLYQSGIAVDLFIPYGSDLFNSPFASDVPVSFSTNIIKFLFEKHRSRLQTYGIQKSKKIIVNTNWLAAKQALVKLNRSAINLPRIMIYKESCPMSIKQKYEWLSDYDFCIFSPTRHQWSTNSDPLPDFIKNGGTKRNDKLIKAYARLVQAKIAQRPLLLLCEYGTDVEDSKKLIDSLDITDYVKWLPLLGRREISEIMRQASIVADQFREGMSATSSGTTNEALAFGKPVITNTDGALSDSMDPYFTSPILQAVSEQEIYDWLVRLALSPEFSKKIGDYGEKWFDSHLSFGLAQKYIDLLSRN